MVQTIDITVTGFTELKDHTNKMIGSLDKMNDDEAQILAKWFETRIKRNAQTMVPHTYRNSGQLERSVKQRKVGDKHYAIEMADYGILLDRGSRPHTIVPTRKSILHWKRYGEDNFAYKVKHPGNKPYLFLTSALLETNAQTKQFGYNICRRIRSFYKE